MSFPGEPGNLPHLGCQQLLRSTAHSRAPHSPSHHPSLQAQAGEFLLSSPCFQQWGDIGPCEGQLGAGTVADAPKPPSSLACLPTRDVCPSLVSTSPHKYPLCQLLQAGSPRRSWALLFFLQEAAPTHPPGC